MGRKKKQKSPAAAEAEVTSVQVRSPVTRCAAPRTSFCRFLSPPAAAAVAVQRGPPASDSSRAPCSLFLCHRARCAAQQGSDGCLSASSRPRPERSKSPSLWVWGSWRQREGLFVFLFAPPHATTTTTNNNNNSNFPAHILCK